MTLGGKPGANYGCREQAEMMSAPTSSPSAAPPGFLRDQRRIGGAAGIVFVILFVIGVVVAGDGPLHSDDIAEVRSFFEEDGDQYLMAEWLFGVAAVLFLIPFAAALRSVLTRNNRSTDVWPLVAFTGAVLFAVFVAIAAVPEGAVALGDIDELDDSTIRAMLYMDAVAFAIVPLGMALLLAGASVAMLETRKFGRWLGAAGLVVALLAVVGRLWVVSGDPEGVLAMLGFLSLPLSALWLLVVSAMMVAGKPTDLEHA